MKTAQLPARRPCTVYVTVGRVPAGVERPHSVIISPVGPQARVRVCRGVRPYGVDFRERESVTGSLDLEPGFSGCTIAPTEIDLAIGDCYRRQVARRNRRGGNVCVGVTARGTLTVAIGHGHAYQPLRM